MDEERKMMCISTAAHGRQKQLDTVGIAALLATMDIIAMPLPPLPLCHVTAAATFPPVGSGRGEGAAAALPPSLHAEPPLPLPPHLLDLAKGRAPPLRCIAREREREMR